MSKAQKITHNKPARTDKTVKQTVIKTSNKSTSGGTTRTSDKERKGS